MPPFMKDADTTGMSFGQREVWAMVEGSDAPSLVVASDGRFIHANARFLKIMGFELDDMAGRALVDYIHPSDRAMAQKSLNAALTPHPLSYCELRLIARDGSAHWLIWKGIWNPKLSVLVLIGNDITERRKKQQIVDDLIHSVSQRSPDDFLNAVTEELARRFDLTTVAISEIAPSARARTLSIASSSGPLSALEYDLAGTACADVIEQGGLRISSCPHEDYPDDPRFTGTSGETYLGFPIQTLDRQRILGVLWVIASGAIHNEFALEWALRILSIQVAAEFERASRGRELERQLTYKRALLRASPDNVFVLNEQFEFIDFFAHREEDLVMPSSQFLGRPVDQILPVSVVERLKAAAAQAKSSGDVIDFEYTIESSKGTVHDYESRVIYCEGIGIISHVRRITQRKEYERRIADQRMQLVNSAKMAAIGEMAAGIAHEINNPLCVISARAIQMRNELKRILHQLQDQIRPDGLENLMRYADGVETMSNRIAAIVRSMWTLARDGQRDPFVKCRLHDIVKDALGITLSRFAHSGVEVIGLPDSVDFVFEARPVQVSQVLLNLLANAYDAVQAYEKKWVRIDARVDGVELEISVTDSGLGLDPAIADRVMNPFFTTKALGHGTGLGLSISRAIVEDHGGRLELDTHAPNTRFVVRLPLKQEKQDRRKRR